MSICYTRHLFGQRNRFGRYPDDDNFLVETYNFSTDSYDDIPMFSPSAYFKPRPEKDKSTVRFTSSFLLFINK